MSVQVGQPGTDPEYLERTTLALRQELLALDVGSVQAPSSGPAPEGTRGFDIAEVGTLIVAVSPAVQAVGNLVVAVLAWLRRGDAGRSVRLKIGDDELELTGGPSTTQDRLVEQWIRAHAQP